METVIVEMSAEQRAYALTESSRGTLTRVLAGMRKRMAEGVEYRGMYMVELTSLERSWLSTRAHATMESMRAQDVNSWVSGEYASLESLLYGLYVGCAE